MGLMVGFVVCWVCLVVGFGEDDDDDEEEKLVRTDGFGMNRDGNDRSRGWRRWLEDWVGGCLVVVWIGVWPDQPWVGC